jgi:glucose/arabinose dehydrogenase
MNTRLFAFFSTMVIFSLKSFAEKHDIGEAVLPSETATISLEVVASDFEIPWALEFLPDGNALVGEREVGRLSRLDFGTGEKAEIVGLPDMLRSKKISAGLFDVVPHPDFSNNSFLYMVHAIGEEESNGLAISRGILKDGKISGNELLFETSPRISGKWHFGGRLVFSGNHMYLSTGDGYDHSNLSQDLSSHAGKILRLDFEGNAAKGNPFENKKGALPEIWSYGVRNPQAMTKHPASGEIWEIEHGPQGGDEINVARSGKNYGWPVITYGEEYGGGPIGDGITHYRGMEQPLYYWLPSIAPSGSTFYTGSAFPRWNGNLFVGALAGKHLSRLVIEGERVIHEEQLLGDKNWRVRFVKQGPDDFLYIGVDDGFIIRLKPGKKATKTQD